MDPVAEEPGPLAGQLRLRLAAADLKSDLWNERRTQFGLAIGLGEGIWFSADGSTRDLSGYGAFQRGMEDARLGLGYWPALSPVIRAGVSGSFLIPTGYRSQQQYYVPAADSTYRMPAFSLRQTAGELRAGGSFQIGPAAELRAYAGYLATADQTDQAFRWGLGARLTPLGPRYAAELGYAQSLTRAGNLPNTESVAAAVAVNVGWGFAIVPGVAAELGDDPLFGGSLGLRFTTRLPTAVLRNAPGAPPVFTPKVLTGRVLVPPPLASVPVAGTEELWQSIREAVGGSFEEVIALQSLDVPGLPYRDDTRVRQDQSLRAIAEAHPEAEWMIITRVGKEEVTRARGMSVPLLVNQKQWIAECRLTVELINLRSIQTRTRHTVEAHATKKETPTLAVVSTPESEVLPTNVGRELTFQAYREAGREIVRLIGTWDSDSQSAQR
ncbi:hypothetical protein KKH27_10435 [bacterium]|nr:hypothetical protein [bacterium]MBU1983485.1 hypothetical protein [bacterium]